MPLPCAAALTVLCGAALDWLCDLLFVSELGRNLGLTWNVPLQHEYDSESHYRDLRKSRKFADFGCAQGVHRVCTPVGKVLVSISDMNALNHGIA